MSVLARKIFVVVHHRNDSSQPWVNSWLDENLLEAITTNLEIGRLCEDVKKNNLDVFVHRCAWNEFYPLVCCSASVIEVAQFDRKTILVKFGNQKVINLSPPVSPHPGQSFYLA